MRVPIPFAVLLAGVVSPGLAAAAPADLSGSWNCTRSVVSDLSAYQMPAMKFRLERTAWTDLTWGPARAVRGKAHYADGVLRLHNAKTGAVLHTFTWRPAAPGQQPRLVEQIGADNKTRSGEVCYSPDAKRG